MEEEQTSILTLNIFFIFFQLLSVRVFLIDRVDYLREVSKTIFKRLGGVTTNMVKLRRAKSISIKLRLVGIFGLRNFKFPLTLPLTELKQDGIVNLVKFSFYSNIVFLSHTFQL